MSYLCYRREGIFTTYSDTCCLNFLLLSGHFPQKNKKMEKVEWVRDESWVIDSKYSTQPAEAEESSSLSDYHRKHMNTYSNAF